MSEEVLHDATAAGHEGERGPVFLAFDREAAFLVLVHSCAWLRHDSSSRHVNHARHLARTAHY